MNWRSLSALRHRRAPARSRRGDLPADHPMTGAIEAVRYTGRQWVHVAAVLMGSAIARVERDGWGLPLMCSAGSVLLALTLLLAVYR